MTTPLVVAVLLLAFQGGAGPAKPQDKPVKEYRFHVDSQADVPDTVDELWKSADIVVEGAVLSERAVDDVITEVTPPVTLIYTAYDIGVTKVFKSGAGITGRTTKVTVQRKGGTRDRGTYIERAVDETCPEFRTGERYILFLTRLENGRFTLVGHAAYGALLVEGDALKPRGHGGFADMAAANPALFRMLLNGKRGDK